MDQLSKVALIQSEKKHVDDIDQQEIDAMVSQALRLIDGLRSVQDGQTVVIKPNLVTAIFRNINHPPIATLNQYASGHQLIPRKANGISHDFRIAHALIKLVRQLNPHGKIYVMENASEGTMEEIFSHLNYTKTSMPEVDAFLSMRHKECTFRDITADSLVSFDIGESPRYDKYPDWLENRHYMDRRYYEADVLISLSCMKNHSETGITGGIKNVAIGSLPGNIYGNSPDNPNRASVINHDFHDLNDFIHDYYKIKPINLTLLDGLQGLSYGPLGIGAPDYETAKQNARLIIASTDPVACDAVSALIMGIDSTKIPHLTTLSDECFGNSHPSHIQVVGNRQVHQVRRQYEMLDAITLGKSKLLPLIMIPEPYTFEPDIKADEISGNLIIESDKTARVEIVSNGEVVDMIVEPPWIVSMDSYKDSVTLRLYDCYLNCCTYDTARLERV